VQEKIKALALGEPELGKDHKPHFPIPASDFWFEISGASNVFEQRLVGFFWIYEMGVYIMAWFEGNYTTGRGPEVKPENSEKNPGGEAFFHHNFPKIWRCV